MEDVLETRFKNKRKRKLLEIETEQLRQEYLKELIKSHKTIDYDVKCDQEIAKERLKQIRLLKKVEKSMLETKDRGFA